MDALSERLWELNMRAAADAMAVFMHEYLYRGRGIRAAAHALVEVCKAASSVFLKGGGERGFGSAHTC